MCSAVKYYQPLCNFHRVNVPFDEDKDDDNEDNDDDDEDDDDDDDNDDGDWPNQSINVKSKHF